MELVVFNPFSLTQLHILYEYLHVWSAHCKRPICAGQHRKKPEIQPSPGGIRTHDSSTQVVHVLAPFRSHNHRDQPIIHVFYEMQSPLLTFGRLNLSYATAVCQRNTTAGSRLIGHICYSCTPIVSLSLFVVVPTNRQLCQYTELG